MSLQVHQRQQTAVFRLLTAFKDAGGKDGMHRLTQSTNHKPQQDGSGGCKDCQQQHGAGQRAKSAWDHPVIQQCENQHITHQQQSCQNSGGEDICGANTAACLIQLDSDILVRFNPVGILRF